MSVWTPLQSATSVNSGATAPACAFTTQNNTAGSIIVAYLAVINPSGYPHTAVCPSACSDNNGNTYSLASSGPGPDQDQASCIFIAVNAKVSPNAKITVTFGPLGGYPDTGAQNPSIILWEVMPPPSFVAIGNPVDLDGEGGETSYVTMFAGVMAKMGTAQQTFGFTPGYLGGNNNTVAVLFLNTDDFSNSLLVAGDNNQNGAVTTPHAPGNYAWSGTGIIATTLQDDSGSYVGALLAYSIVDTSTGVCGYVEYIVIVQCNNPPNGTVGTVYAGAAFTASGGVSPYTYAITGGSLPPGLSMTTGGVVSGTPTSAGVFPFIVSATDSDGNTGSVSCSISIISTFGALCLSPPGGVVGTFYTHSLGATGGVPPYNFTLLLGSLPPGLGMNSSGLISGVPTAVGVYTFTVQVTDSAFNTAQVTCTISITAVAPNPMRLTCCDNSIYFDYTDTSGSPVCLRYEVSKKRWFLEYYGDGIVTHYLAEGTLSGPSKMSIWMPSRTQNLIYLAGGDTDNNVVIPTTVHTSAMDSGDQRAQKLYVDTMLDIAGTGNVTVQAFYNDDTMDGPELNVVVAGVREQRWYNISSLADLALYRNISMQFSWTGGPDGPQLYATEPSGFLQPYLSTFFVTQFIPFSFPGWKSMRRMYPAMISNANVLLTIQTQDGRTYGPFTIPSTGGRYRILPQMLSQNIKDLAFALQLDGQGTPFAFFPSDFTIEVKQWIEETYINLAVFKA
jgi:hypothetical protein